MLVHDFVKCPLPQSYEGFPEAEHDFEHPVTVLVTTRVTVRGGQVGKVEGKRGNVELNNLLELLGMLPTPDELLPTVADARSGFDVVVESSQDISLDEIITEVTL